MRKSVLLVDDQQKVRTELRAFLTPLGFDVTEAQNGLDGLSKLASTQPDICVIDDIMPVMCGQTLVKNIRESNQHRHVPVILMTTQVLKDVQQKMSVYDAVECIQKPVNYTKLTSILDQYVMMSLSA